MRNSVHKFYIKKAFDKFNTLIYLSDNYLTSRHELPQDYNIGNNSKYKISKRLSLQAQIELRLNNQLGISFATGFGVSWQIKNLIVEGNLKYYQSEFNLGYGVSGILTRGNRPYRNGEIYIGEQLYPLKNYYRTYSQWANYTKQQNRDLMGFELNALWEKRIWKNIHFFTDIDFSIIGNPQKQVGETIPLYSIGLRNKYFDFLRTEFYLTNKFMNLDTFYQTFQASKRPFFGGRVMLDFKGI